ncbi:hypothetical protein ACP4OV_026272 [Aristida adscensionis]
MVSINVSLPVLVVLAGFSVAFGIGHGRARQVHICGGFCEETVYMSCANFPSEQFAACACECKPPGGQSCVIHNPGRWTEAPSSAPTDALGLLRFFSSTTLIFKS